MVRLHFGQRTFLQRGGFRRELHMHQLTCHIFAQTREQAFKQGKSFCLILVEWITLGIAAQADRLAQMVKHLQVFAPTHIDCLEKDGALNLAQHILSDISDFPGHCCIGRFIEAFADFLVCNTFFGRPFCNRQVQAENTNCLAFQAINVPLLRICLFGHMGCHQVVDTLVTHIRDIF